MSIADFVEKTMKKVVIDPVTRVEGHGKVTIIIDTEGRINSARLHIVEFRGFERFIQGRPYWEAPTVVQRLCGICPVSHHLASAKAMDVVVGVGPKGLSPTAEKMRRLMHYGQILQSHALHFYYLCSPDLLFGFDSDVMKRNVLAVAQEYPEIAKQGIFLRRYGQEIIQATAGKKIHGTGAIPGGINKNLTLKERNIFLKDIDQMIEWGQAAVQLVKKVHAMGEDAKTAVRQIRRDANEAIKKQQKEGGMSEDDAHRELDDVQKATDRHTGQIDELCKNKEKELMEV